MSKIQHFVRSREATLCLFLRQVRIEVGFLRDREDWQPTWSALLYWRKRLIVPFLRFGALLSTTGTLPMHITTFHSRTAYRCTLSESQCSQLGAQTPMHAGVACISVCMQTMLH